MKGEPTPISEVLAKMVQATPLGDALLQARIWEHWPTIAGDPLWMHGQPVGLRDGTLIVEAENAQWMHRYTFHRRRIQSRVNKVLGKGMVTEVFVRLAEGRPGVEGADPEPRDGAKDR